MTASPRRFGAETSKTRDVLLDCVEQLMLEEGYAAVTFRAVAAKAEVTSSLVQYYFRTLDGIFLAAIRRYAERNIAHVKQALQAPPEQLLRVLRRLHRQCQGGIRSAGLNYRVVGGSVPTGSTVGRGYGAPGNRLVV